MYVYCKAYHLRDLRAFSGWREAEEVEEGTASQLADDSIVYILDDFTVVATPFQHTRRLFTDVTDAWKEYCRRTLHFECPAELLPQLSATGGNPELQ